MRSIARFPILASTPRLRASPRAFRARHKSSAPAEGLPLVDVTANNFVGSSSEQSVEPNAGPSSGPRSERSTDIEDAVTAFAVEEEPSRPSRNGKNKQARFKSLEGKSMNPKRTPGSGKKNKNVLVSEGTLLDNVFQPLHRERVFLVVFLNGYLSCIHADNNDHYLEVSGGSKRLIPHLKHGLDAVLKRQGVHWLKDPSTGGYNFPEYLEAIPSVADFAFDRLPPFLPSSQDPMLLEYAKQADCQFAGSTSSLTGILAQIYLLLSEEKYVNLSNLSDEFEGAPRHFTPGQRIPTSVFLRYKDGVYTTDYDSDREESKEEVVLLPLGTLLEKFLTLPQNIFSKFIKTHTDDHPALRDTHRYAKRGKFLMRSQLDCRDKNLPGSGVFDIKTRAISEIRHDVHNYRSYQDRKLETLTGRYGSFESEYYDMIRSAFLEYSFQARIGGMDGVFVAYHNVAQIFGFQYISLDEMDTALFGRAGAGDRVFHRCVMLMAILYRTVVDCFPGRSLKATFEKGGRMLRVWVEPLDGAAPADVVELQLSLKNIMHGRPARGAYAVYAAYPWTLQYRIERSAAPQEEILENRGRAYKRQMSIANSLPPDRESPEDFVAAVEHAKYKEALSEGGEM
ncbi:mitochondrial protein Pet127-domain-containing protein [Trametes elegans]|nr:mitochondrial protein Pet127-domain-containing protein [Trametes elegans]